MRALSTIYKVIDTRKLRKGDWYLCGGGGIAQWLCPWESAEVYHVIALREPRQ